MVLGPDPMSLCHLGSEGLTLLAWCDGKTESPLPGSVAQDLCLLIRAAGHGLSFLPSC